MKLAKIFFSLFLISIPFGTRILLYQFTSGFNEYSSAFLYASDISMVLFLLFSYSNVLENLRMRNTAFFIFLLLAAVSVFFAVSPGLAFYNFARLVLLVLMAFAAGKIIREGIVKLDAVFAILAGSAAFQSIIGFLQFIKQSSLGLGWLGESPLGPDIGGAAKIVVDGVKILRAYGTFPHPNVLAAFLLLGLFSLYYLWLKADAKFLNANDTKKSTSRNSYYLRIFSIGLGIFIIFLGLILTFSRTAWAIGGLLTIFSVIYFLFSQPHRRAAAALLLVIVASGYAFATIFAPYIYTRATISQTEPSVSYRLAYNKMALDLIKDRPLGVGIGNQVLYSVQNGIYQKFGMDQAWQWQPIHNLYLLIASEIGVAGLLVFGFFLAILLKISKPKLQMPNKFQNPNDQKFDIWILDFVIPKAILVALLLFGLFDHFLWTLQPGRLMLWLVIGIILALRSPRSTTDSTYPSEG